MRTPLKITEYSKVLINALLRLYSKLVCINLLSRVFNKF